MFFHEKPLLGLVMISSWGHQTNKKAKERKKNQDLTIVRVIESLVIAEKATE